MQGKETRQNLLLSARSESLAARANDDDDDIVCLLVQFVATSNDLGEKRKKLVQ